jgi:hypothetical protein
MPTAIQAAPGKAEEEPILDISATTTTRPGGGWAPPAPSSGSSGSGSGEPGCGLGRWDVRVQGRPVGFAGGERAGDYLWHDATGFHLALTHRGDRRDVFTGTIQANAAMAMRPVRLEGRDAVALSADRHTLYFRFYDYGHVDAVDFVTDCASRLVVGNLRMDGLALPTDRVYLGAARAHPARVPFTLSPA